MRFFLLFLALFGLQCSALEVPPHTDLVVDLARVLSPNERQTLSASLREFQRDYGPQLQLLIVPSLEDETPESFAIKVVDKWKLGTKSKDDGVLLLVAVKERALRIEVGQGLEGQLPDALAGRIISGAMIPLFKQGHFSLGVFTGLGAIAKAVGGELKNVPEYRVSSQSRKGHPLFFLFFFFLFFIFLNILSRGRRGSTSSVLAGYVLGSLMGSSRRSSGWGGGGGFGGFGGGGGGGFSGGGASGRW